MFITVNLYWIFSTVEKAITEDANLLDSLGFRLDAPHRVIKNHEHLACTLGVPPNIRARCKLNTIHSPTKQLLALLQAHKPGLTVAKFISALKRIGRNDVVNTIVETLPGKRCLIMSKNKSITPIQTIQGLFRECTVVQQCI